MNQRFGGKRDLLSDFLGNDLVVVRKFALDQAHDEGGFAPARETVIAFEREFDLIGIIRRKMDDNPTD